MADITDNMSLSRFELTEDGHTVFAAYRKEPGKLFINYVESPAPLRGKGSAGRLMAGIVAFAHAEKLEIVPICGYAVSWLRKNGA